MIDTGFCSGFYLGSGFSKIWFLDGLFLGYRMDFLFFVQIMDFSLVFLLVYWFVLVFRIFGFSVFLRTSQILVFGFSWTGWFLLGLIGLFGFLRICLVLVFPDLGFSGFYIGCFGLMRSINFCYKCRTAQVAEQSRF